MLPISGGRSTQDVFIQDQTTGPFHYYLMREDKTDITLTSAVTKSDVVIHVSPSHGFIGGERIVIMENNLYIQQKVISVSTNDITISQPCPFNFTTGATVIRGSIEMNVDGSSTEQTFQFNFRNATIPIDIQMISLVIWNSLDSGDDGTFGDITELTNGLLVRKVSPTVNQSLGVYRANSGFKEYGGVVSYDSKAPAGTYGVHAIFNIKDVYGIVLRVDPRIPNTIEAVVRDDLSNLNRLRISAMGQYTQGE